MKQLSIEGYRELSCGRTTCQPLALSWDALHIASGIVVVCVTYRLGNWFNFSGNNFEACCIELTLRYSACQQNVQCDDSVMIFMGEAFSALP